MIIFTKHALQRMKERKISKKEVGDVIDNPDSIKRDTNRIIAKKKFKGKTIEVIFAKEGQKSLIITCYLV